jgi:Archaeal fructose-1,6-bisphosphatase and related enzymes of inositol monophosphatase family
MEEELEVIKAIVRQAGQIMLEAHHIQDGVTSKQGSANFVTEYDVRVQKFLFQELKKKYPDAAFVGEEDEKREICEADYCFVIDPIDGTTNFIFDYRHSSISVGVLYQGEIYMGVVYNPYLNEIFYGEKGKGAFLNGRKLKINDLCLQEGIVGFGTCPYYRENAEESFQIIRKLYDRCLDVRRSGSAALDICYVAAGRFVLFFEKILSPWDYAAASLILMEAGGCIGTFGKERINYDAQTSVIAATPKAYEEFFHL